MQSNETASILGQPIKLGPLTLANRMVMGPMAAHFASKDGTVSDQTVAYFEARARGGVGMIILGGVAGTTRPIEEFAGKLTPLRLDDDRYIPGARRLVDAIHRHNVPVVAEIAPSMGRMANHDPIAASPKNVIIAKDRSARGFLLPADVVTPIPREVSIAEIKAFEQDMVTSAERMQRAGLDGVEVAALMSYFLASFLTPRTNWRTDEYGGSVENRARILVNIVSGVRARVGPNFVVGLRITSNEYLPDGQDAEGYAAIAKLVVAAGADYVALSPGCYETQNIAMSATDGIMVDSGDGLTFKQAVSVPVFLQGIHDPGRSAESIAGGHGDVIMLARSLLADPDYPRKVLERRPDSIVACKRDNYCVRRFAFNMPVRCEVNPRLGLESRGTQGPQLSRIFQAPIEEAFLKVTGSPAMMKLAGAVMAKRR